MLYTRLMPFGSRANSVLGVVAMVQVFFTMLAGLLIKLDVTADEGYDEEVGSSGLEFQASSPPCYRCRRDS